MDEKDQKLKEINQILTSSSNWNPILMPEVKLDKYQQSNLDGLESESSMIRFLGPHGLSLLCSRVNPSLVFHVLYRNKAGIDRF